MRIDKFNIFSRKRYIHKKRFSIGEIVRRLSDDRLGKINSIGLNKDKSDNYQIFWYDENETLEGVLLKQPNPSFPSANGDWIIYSDNEIDKLSPEDQEYLDNIGKYNV